MPEPLSITAAVVGITATALQSVQFLAKTIDNIKDAPRTVKFISADLRAVESVLQDLEVQADSPQPIQSKQIGPAVENCDRACKAFQLQVEHWMNRSKDDKMFWVSRWRVGLFGQERIKTFKGQLSDCKSTLSVALATATLLAVTSQKDLAKEQRDSMLRVNEADLAQELISAGNEGVEIERNLQQLIVRGSTEPDEESEQSKQELLQELRRQQAGNNTFREMCEEALSKTVYERTGQKIKGVKATNNSSAVTGFINTSGEESKIDQDISDVTADGHSVVIAGVVKGFDFKDLRLGKPGGS
ncbi:hypothetical protein P152DRAFT_403517 [Eremomyces bilateralis CBS 781.70]|uniref:Azaphilone pigments biosynthesis cluster protein L N-terminal domain-containing protein n=1 Tax=Eremomyces bilateralis CBS 781.70 TaxID=1392243 RepID=A0A6G1FU50_9PEZI|nr:uncharacterized protein P152DRAFT_403517 [Eremomyces bilateralis CBS 781.70]KAF1809327.1 hypothetical protein P152DRAFT_403517 [Eremomyces bilateralis CBS 781.70]